MKLLVLLSLLFAVPSLSAIDLAGVAWEKKSDGDGIIVYQWNDPKSELFAFMVEGVVDASIPKVASVLIDEKRRPEWVHNLAEARVVRGITKVDRVEYVHINTPFVVKDRDFVIQGHADFDKAQKKVTLSFHSISDPEVPETGYIRGQIYESSYILKPTADGKGTFIQHILHVDPKGSIAKWIVNMFQKGFPRKTFEGIRKQVQKDDIVDHAEIKKWIDSAG